MSMAAAGPGGAQFGPRPGTAGTPNQQFLGQSPTPSSNPASVPSPAGPMTSAGMSGFVTITVFSIINSVFIAKINMAVAKYL